MKIKSKFKDYYDSAMGLGVDPNLLYLRETSPIEDESYVKSLVEHYIPKNFRYKNITFSGVTFALNTGAVFFCGKVFKYIEVYIYGLGSNKPVERPRFHLYSVENFLRFVNRDGVQLTSDGSFTAYHHLPFSLKGVTKYFEDSHKDIDLDIFFKYQCPVLLLQKDKIDGKFIFEAKTSFLERNPFLKPFNFMSVKSNYEAFQEISMFLGGVIGQKKEVPVQVSDEIMRDKKGFDDKSFKTPSPGKKFNRRTKKTIKDYLKNKLCGYVERCFVRGRRWGHYEATMCEHLTELDLKLSIHDHICGLTKEATEVYSTPKEYLEILHHRLNDCEKEVENHKEGCNGLLK